MRGKESCLHHFVCLTQNMSTSTVHASFPPVLWPPYLVLAGSDERLLLVVSQEPVLELEVVRLPSRREPLLLHQVAL